jgi:cohesin complex subunit SA-1/2
VRHLGEVSGSDEDLSSSPSFASCKDLASRLSSTFLGMARAKFRPSILGIVRGGIEYAFFDTPRQLSFLEGGVIQFALKLPPADIREM